MKKKIRKEVYLQHPFFLKPGSLESRGFYIAERLRLQALIQDKQKGYDEKELKILNYSLKEVELYVPHLRSENLDQAD